MCETRASVLDPHQVHKNVHQTTIPCRKVVVFEPDWIIHFEDTT